MNIRTIFLPLGLLLLLVFTSCQKRKARKTLEGSWNVVGSRGQLHDDCTDRDTVLNIFESYLGTIDFSRKQVERDYQISGLDKACFNHSARNDKRDWKVIKHQEVLFTANTYLISIGEEQWQCIFGKGQLGEEANNQDNAFLAQIGDNGDAITYELERVK